MVPNKKDPSISGAAALPLEVSLFPRGCRKASSTESLEAGGRSSVPPSHWEAAARRQLPSRCGEGTLCSLAPSAPPQGLRPRGPTLPLARAVEIVLHGYAVLETTGGEMCVVFPRRGRKHNSPEEPGGERSSSSLLTLGGRCPEAAAALCSLALSATPLGLRPRAIYTAPCPGSGDWKTWQLLAPLSLSPG
jgi:hypothetical protein